MMSLMLPAVISTQEDQDVLPDDTTMYTVRPPTVLMTILLTTSPSSTSLQYTRNWFKGKSFVYNNGGVGLSFKIILLPYW